MEIQNLQSPELFVKDQKYKNQQSFSRKQQHQLAKDVKLKLQRNIQQLKMKKLMDLPELQINQENNQQININLQKVQNLCKIILNHDIFRYTYLILLAIFMILCLLQDPNQYPHNYHIVITIQLTCHAIFLFISVLKIVQYKNVKVFWLLLEISTSICAIIGLNLQNQQIGRYFKAYRSLKIVFLITQIPVFNEPATHLLKALAKVRNIFIPMIVIIYVYTVIGLRAFTDLQYNKCRDPQNIQFTQNWTVNQQISYLCGIRSCPIINNTKYQCLNPIQYGVNPNTDQLENINQGYGLLVYSNIAYSLFSVIKQTFITGSSRLNMLYSSAISPVFVNFFNYSYVTLISYIYLNIFYSMIIRIEWKNQEDTQTTNDNQIDKKQKIKNQIEKIDCKKQIRNTNIFRAKTKICKIKQNQHNKQTQSFQKLGVTNLQNNQLKNQQIIQGTLQLHKARIFNVFQQVDGQFDVPFDDIPKIKSQGSIDIQGQWEQIHHKFTIINHIIILLTCINLSLDYHNQDTNFKFTVDCIDFGFYCVLIILVLVEIYLDRYYLKSIQIYTKIDIGILIISTVGFIYEGIIAQNVKEFFSVNTSVQGVLRSTKYIRIMFLILTNTYFLEARLILQSTMRSVYQMKNVFGLWLIIVILFTICGFHLHSYKDQNQYQISYNGMFKSFVFTSLTFYNQEWDYIMFQQFLGSGGLIVIWQFLSLFVGLILFSKYFMSLLMNQLDNIIDQKREQTQNINSIFSEKQINSQSDQDSQYMGNRIMQDSKTPSVKFKAGQIDIKKVTFAEVSHQQPKQSKLKTKISKKFSSQSTIQSQICLRKFHHLFKKFIQSLGYRLLWVCMILLSIFVLSNLHPHADRQSQQVKTLLILDIVVKSFFLLDLLFNISVYNVCMSQNSYFRRSRLNWINIIIIIIQMISYTEVGENQVFLKIYKIRVLRILFFIEIKYRSDWNMRMTFQSLIQLLPKVFSLLAVTTVMYTYFALILVKMYKDQNYKCQNYVSEAQIITKNDCLNWGGDWVQSVINTSNITQSLIYLFLVATTQGWITMMKTAMNFSGPNMQPIQDSNEYISIFFIAFFFFGNLIMLNVFIGLSVSNLKRLKDIATGQSKLSNKQKMWLAIKTQIYRLQPLVLIQKPNNAIRGFCFNICSHWFYKIFQGICCLSFLIAMSFYSTNLDQKTQNILGIIQYFYASLLITQYIFQLLAYGIRNQYKKTFFVKSVASLYSIVYICISQGAKLSKNDMKIAAASFIAIQLIAYLSLLDDIPFFNKMLNSLVTIFPRASNIFLLLTCTLVIYAIIGMQLFSFLKSGQQLDGINQGYQSFILAIQSLVKFSTMQSPIQQINDAARTLGPNFICQEVYYYSQFQVYGQMGCGNVYFSYIFFLSFHIFYSILLISTLIAVIVDSYGQIYKEQNAYITKFLLKQVRRAWARIDPEATGYIPYRQFWMFTAKLISIYQSKNSTQTGAKQRFSKLYAQREKFLNDMSIPIYQNERNVLCFQFHEVIEGLTRVYLKNTIGTKIKTQKAERMFRQRTSAIFQGFKKSEYKSEHVTTLIILKTGLRWWKNLATTSNKMIQYKSMVTKFSTFTVKPPSQIEHQMFKKNSQFKNQQENFESVKNQPQKQQ